MSNYTVATDMVSDAGDSPTAQTSWFRCDVNDVVTPQVLTSLCDTGDSRTAQDSLLRRRDVINVVTPWNLTLLRKCEVNDANDVVTPLE